MKASVFLSVVIPAFDEMANLQKGVLDKVAKYLQQQKYTYEVIVVDDGSSDGSVEYLEKFVKQHKGFSLIKNPHLGKAGAVTTGVLVSKGEYVLFTDMDQATPIEEVSHLLPFFKENLPTGKQGYDVVIGSRSRVRKGAPFTRMLMARGMILFRSVIVGLPGISDTQCGFKMFTHEASQKIFTKFKDLHHGFRSVSGSSVTAAFDVEILLIASKMGYQIKEVPVSWLYVETRRVSPIRDSLEAVFELLAIKKNELNGKYTDNN